MKPVSVSGRVECKRCIHFRQAPFQAHTTGCWFPGNMVSRQSAAYLDQQQQPGNHEKINLRGDCPDFEAPPQQLSWWERLWSVGA